MKYYAFDATRPDGTIVTGELAANSHGEAISALESQGLVVISVRQNLDGPTQLSHPNEDSVIVAEPVVLNPEAWKDRLDQAIAARQDWIPALEALTTELPSGHTKLTTGRILSQLKSDFSAEQFLQTPKLAQMLPLLVQEMDSRSSRERLQNWFQALVRQQTVRSEQLKSLVYPVGLVLLALTITALLSILIVPIFKEMFEEFGLSLPAATVLLVRISDAFVYELPWTVAGILGFVGLFLLGILLWKKYSLSNYVLGFLSNGSSSNLRAMSILSGNLAELLQLGVPLALAVELAGRHSGNRYYASVARGLASVMRSGRSIRSGGHLHQLPSTVVLALQELENPLEKANRSIAVLREMSQVYAERSLRVSGWMQVVFPSLAMVVVAQIIGFVVVALFMPLVTIIRALA